MTVASPPWATLWGGLSALGAFIAVAVAIIVFWLSNRRRVLLYSTPVVTSLLSTPAPHMAEGDIHVMFKGQPLTDPHLVTLRVESKSRKDISNRDFNADKPLVIRLGTSFAASVSEPTKVPVDKLSIENSDISIGPCLIRRGPVVQLQFVTEGPPHTSYKSELIDIDVRPDNEGYQQLRRRLKRTFRIAIVFTYIFIGVFFNTTAPHLPPTAGSLSSAHSWIQYFISALLWPLSFWHPTFTLGRWLP
jgi:hypothetical protein